MNLNVFHGKFIDKNLIEEQTKTSGDREKAIKSLLGRSEINNEKIGNDILSRIGRPVKR